MALLFISSVVPDEERFHNAAFMRSGNNVLLGIAEALWKHGNCDLLSYEPTPSYPRGRLWFGKKNVIFESGMIVKYAPFLNVKILKNIFEGIYTLFFVLNWSRRHWGERNTILVYNIYDPPISFLYKACKLSQTRLYAILYDLGVPPKRLGLSKATMIAYRLSEISAKKYIPKLDGRIVINEAIVDHYAPGKDSILIDGGINDSIISQLFSLEESQSPLYTFVCAGMLWDQNGTKLIIDAMRVNTNPKIRVIFAGRGIDVPLIESASKEDSRISYAGMLSLQELFGIYKEADVLLNLRLEEEIDFHFPSKLLEYMVTGKLVVSTPIAHAERDYGHFIKFLQEASPNSLSELMNSITEIPKKVLFQKGIEERAFMISNRNWARRTEDILCYLNK